MPRCETSGDFALANHVAGAGRINPRACLEQRSIDLRRLVGRALDGGGQVGVSLGLIEIRRLP
jgi:hypothetical protein